MYCLLHEKVATPPELVELEVDEVLVEVLPTLDVDKAPLDEDAFEEEAFDDEAFDDEAFEDDPEDVLVDVEVVDPPLEVEEVLVEEVEEVLDVEEVLVEEVEVELVEPVLEVEVPIRRLPAEALA